MVQPAGGQKMELDGARRSRVTRRDTYSPFGGSETWSHTLLPFVPSGVILRWYRNLIFSRLGLSGAKDCATEQALRCTVSITYRCSLCPFYAARLIKVITASTANIISRARSWYNAVFRGGTPPVRCFADGITSGLNISSNDITDSFFFFPFLKRCILVIEQIILLNDSISILSSIPRYLYLISFSYSLTRCIRY